MYQYKVVMTSPNESKNFKLCTNSFTQANQEFTTFVSRHLPVGGEMHIVFYRLSEDNNYDILIAYNKY